MRVEFFDDEIDALRSFDVMNQRSIEALPEARVLPAGSAPLTAQLWNTGLATCVSRWRRAYAG